MSDFKRNFYVLHFDKMCRLCLSQNMDIIYIFSKTNDDESSLKERIKECVTLEVSENDGLPQNICGQCIQKVNDWHDFKSLCVKSDLVLREHLCVKSTQPIGQMSTLDNCFSLKLDVKSEVEEQGLYPQIKQEGDNNCDDLFSESDEKPLIEMKTTQKKKRKNGKKKKNEQEQSQPSAKGRAPKVKPLCLVCHQKFTRFVELIEHQNKMHNLNLNDVNVNSENAIEQLKVNIDAFAIFKCHICKEKYSNREDLRNHCKSVHNTKVIQPYPCSHCDRQFPAWGLLVIHERKHTGEKPYSCDVCGKQNFISHTSLRRHKLMHLKVYSCQECGRDFNCDSALKAHIRCKHTNEKPFLCNVCGRSFSLSAILMAHMTSHSSERKYICDVCGFASKTSGNHSRHKNIHKTTGVKSFHCETCGKSFDTKLKLSSHQIIHRPVRPHVCKVCGKAFLYKNKLERHVLLVHARERPFPCSLCGKKLASKFGLGIHLKTHNRNDNAVKAEQPEVQ